MKYTLTQAPNGSTNDCFGLVRGDTCHHFIQFDWDRASLASLLGWVSCHCGKTDGTIDCEHNTAQQMLGNAFDYLSDNAGKVFNLENIEGNSNE